MISAWWLIPALMVGALIGVVTMCIIIVGGRSDK